MSSATEAVSLPTWLEAHPDGLGPPLARLKEEP
jgi:hypothetical protein